MRDFTSALHEPAGDLRHDDLVERLRMAFEGAGHRILQAADPLEALAKDAWGEAQVPLVDSGGDPMDGYRLCRLLRGRPGSSSTTSPSSSSSTTRRRSRTSGPCRSPGRWLRRLRPHHPAAAQPSGARCSPKKRLPGRGPAGYRSWRWGFSPSSPRRPGTCCTTTPWRCTPRPPATPWKPSARCRPPCLCWVCRPHGVEGALAVLARLREQGRLPYTILVGHRRTRPTSGGHCWPAIPGLRLPPPAPRLVHACKRAIEWDACPPHPGGV